MENPNYVAPEETTYDIPRGWPKYPVFPDSGDVPGPPIQFEELKPDSVKAGYTFTDPNMIGEVDEYFYHGDHISSVVLVTDKKAKVVQQFAYMPFGELLVDNSTVDLDFRFSAKETDRESGLGYFGARYYDNTSAMWLGVDPLWKKYAGMNPYNYCAGNPVMLVDRDGRAVINQDEQGLVSVQAKIDNYESHFPFLKEDRNSANYKSVDKTYRKRYENLLRERDHQNKLIQLTAEKIQYFKETEPEKFNKINNLRGMYEGKEVEIDVYVTSEYQSYQRDPNNPTMILDFSSGGYTGFPSEGVLTIAVNSGKKVNVSTHLDPSLPKNTDRIAHEFGHIYGFSLDMLKYIRENTAGDNCQEIAKQGGVLPFTVKHAIEWQNSYK